MDLHRKQNGRWELRWREAGRRRSRTFDRKGDAVAFESDRVRRKQLGHSAIPDDIRISEFVETYWRLHAVPNLASSTREFYKLTWANHIMPRLGDYGVRELTPKRLARFREELERAGVGVATVRKTMAIIQSILSFAVAEELVEFNAAASVRKPRYERAREPHIFLPIDVERMRSTLKLRDRTLVSVLAYSGPRPEEVVCRLTWGDIGQRTIRYRDTKRHRDRFAPLLSPLADDLRAWLLASGRPNANRPVFPAHDGGFWDRDDWSNWRESVWKSRPERRYKRSAKATVLKGTIGCAPASTRPRDLRSSFITIQVYAGVPKHYASVIENWEGVQVPAEQQIRAARESGGRGVDVTGSERKS